jgi:hypothetical protein
MLKSRLRIDLGVLAAMGSGSFMSGKSLSSSGSLTLICLFLIFAASVMGLQNELGVIRGYTYQN